MQADPTRTDPRRIEPGVAHRLARYTAAAGLGSFAFGQAANAEVLVFEAGEFLQKSLVGNPYYPAPIEDAYYPGEFPFPSVRWATAGFAYQYGGYYYNLTAFGMDLDGNGTGDINFFRGPNYSGYLIASTATVGYAYGPVAGSGQVDLLSNDADNPDTDGNPAPSATKRILQGFNAGEVIGDGNDTNIGQIEGIMRDAYAVGDWDGVPDNYGNLYATGNPGESSFVGFRITGLDSGTGEGFGWIEVVVREGTHEGFDAPSHPELQILRWAFTDDGTPIAAGDTGTEVLVGDLNGDGFVGAGDLDILLGVWNQNVSGDVADLNDDGFIGAGDLDILLGNWNAGTPPTAAAAVPEPGTLALLAIGAGGAAVRRRRRA